MAIKKINFGKTNLDDLYQVFGYETKEEFDNKKARLFPSGNADNEVSTTSIFLASLSAVREYREELFMQIGIAKLKPVNAKLHVYTELFSRETGDRPDGLIVITSGKHNPIIEWACLVESKVKDNTINETQIEKYVDFAREMGINDIITISNYLTTKPTENPITLKKRSFNLYHWSWTYLKVTASRLIRIGCIQDEDHEYILKELRRYFDSHKNLSNFTNMGKEWKDAVNNIHDYKPEQKIDDKILKNIIESYKQEEKDISLQLTDKTELHVELLTTKNDRLVEIEKMLQSSKIIKSDFIVNNDKNNVFSIEVDFLRRKIKCFTHIGIPKGKAVAQTSSLIKMFGDVAANEHIKIKAIYNRKKSVQDDISLSQLIKEKNLSNDYSILNKEFGDEVKYFEIKTEDLLGKDFQSVKNFIIKLEDNALRFLTQVMRNKK